MGGRGGDGLAEDSEKRGLGEEGSAFQSWAPGLRGDLGRPVPRILAMTCGLDKLHETLRCTEAQPAEGLYDDQGGFLVLPGPAVGAKPVMLGGRYRLIRLLGMGTFAQTVEAEDEMSNQQPRSRVAIKIMRSGMQEIGRREAELLHMLRRRPGFSSANIVAANSSFDMGEHSCITMELLAQPLPHYLRSVRPFSLPMGVMRKLTMQLSVALSFLSVNGVIHADIRPENVLVCLSRHTQGSGEAEGLRVRLADFGNGMFEGQDSLECEGMELQTLPYRAPEVVLGLPITALIDVWSLGCLLMEVYMGRRLLNPYSASAALSTMNRTLGPLPDHMLASVGLVGEGGGASVAGGGLGGKSLFPGMVMMSKVAALLDRGGEVAWEEEGKERRLFTSFVAGCLSYDPSFRISPKQALLHPFLAPLSPVPFLCPDFTSPPPALASPPPALASLHRSKPPAQRGLCGNKVVAHNAVAPQRLPAVARSSRSPSVQWDAESVWASPPVAGGRGGGGETHSMNGEGGDVDCKSAVGQEGGLGAKRGKGGGVKGSAKISSRFSMGDFEKRESVRKNKGAGSSAWWIASGSGDGSDKNRTVDGDVGVAPQWAKQFAKKRKGGADREWTAPGSIRGLEDKEGQKGGGLNLNARNKRLNKVKDEFENEHDEPDLYQRQDNNADEEDDQGSQGASRPRDAQGEGGTAGMHSHGTNALASRSVSKLSSGVSTKEKGLVKEEKVVGGGTSDQDSGFGQCDEGRAARRNRGAKPGEWWVVS